MKTYLVRTYIIKLCSSKYYVPIRADELTREHDHFRTNKWCHEWVSMLSFTRLHFPFFRDIWLRTICNIFIPYLAKLASYRITFPFYLNLFYKLMSFQNLRNTFHYDKNKDLNLKIKSKSIPYFVFYSHYPTTVIPHSYNNYTIIILQSYDNNLAIKKYHTILH